MVPLVPREVSVNSMASVSPVPNRLDTSMVASPLVPPPFAPSLMVRPSMMLLVEAFTPSAVRFWEEREPSSSLMPLKLALSAMRLISSFRAVTSFWRASRSTLF